MDFFESQDRARRSSRFLVFYFALAVAGIILAVYLVAVFLFGSVQLGADGEVQLAASGFRWWDPQVFVFAAGGTALAIALASLWKTSELRAGGGAVAASLGGRRIHPDTRDPDERRLMNVVEEMAIASGVSVPEVYVMDEEESINGFAAGLTLQDAAIAVTSGCMKKLSRDELQGVIAHEFSHILNGDMRLNVRLLGLLFGIMFLTIAGYGLMRVLFFAPRGGRNEKGGGAAVGIFAFGVALFLIGSIGVFFGRLIQSGVSRQREFLADAAAVQFTRNPEGIAGALQKIGAGSSVVRHQEATDIAHFFFASGFSMDFGGLFATHPPLERRIKAILPSWDGEMNRPISPARSKVAPSAKKAPSGGSRAASPGGVLRNMGIMDAGNLQHSMAVHAALAGAMLEAVHSPQQAIAVALCLAMDRDEGVRTKQLELVRQKTDRQLAGWVDGLSASVLASEDRMVLLEMMVPALKENPGEVGKHSELLTELCQLSNGDDLFPWLTAIFLRSLRASAFSAENQSARSYPLADACGRLFVRLVEFEADDPAERDEILEKCTAAFSAVKISGLRHDAYPKSFKDLELSLLRLRSESPAIRKKILEAGMTIVLHDGAVSVDEHMVLQLFALVMDAPLPPQARSAQ